MSNQGNLSSIGIKIYFRAFIVKEKAPGKKKTQNLDFQPQRNGAGNGTRTRGIQLGKLMLYQLSYARAKSTTLYYTDNKLLMSSHFAVLVLLSSIQNYVIYQSRLADKHCKGDESSPFYCIKIG